MCQRLSTVEPILCHQEDTKGEFSIVPKPSCCKSKADQPTVDPSHNSQCTRSDDDDASYSTQTSRIAQTVHNNESNDIATSKQSENSTHFPMSCTIEEESPLPNGAYESDEDEQGPLFCYSHDNEGTGRNSTKKYSHPISPNNMLSKRLESSNSKKTESGEFQLEQNFQPLCDEDSVCRYS